MTCCGSSVAEGEKMRGQSLKPNADPLLFFEKVSRLTE